MHHPGAVVGRARARRRRRGRARAPVPRRARRTTCSRSRRASATSRASRRTRPPSASSAEEVGLRGRAARAARRVLQLARLLRRALARVPRASTSTPVADATAGRRGAADDDRARRARRRRSTLDRRTASSSTPRRSSACCSPAATAARRCRLSVDRAGADALPLDVEEFLTWLRGRAGPVGQHARRLPARPARATARGCARAGTARSDDVTEADIERYVADAAGRRHGAPASVARALVAVRSLHRFLRRGGPRRRATRPPTSTSPRVPQGLPKALTEDEVEPLLDAVVGDDAARRAATGRSSRCCTAPACASPSWSGCRSATSTSTTALLRVFGKGAKERIVPLGRLRRATPWPTGSTRAAGGALVPERWARRGDAEAVFLNARGGRLTRQGAWGIVRTLRRPGRASATGSARTCCATRAPPTCSTTAPTSGSCRSCSATRRSRPPRCTRRSRRAAAGGVRDRPPAGEAKPLAL